MNFMAVLEDIYVRKIFIWNFHNNNNNNKKKINLQKFGNNSQEIF